MLKDSRITEIFHFVLWLALLAVLCLRTTFTESPLAPTTDASQPLTNEAYSVILSSSLLAVAGLWWLGCACRRQWTWRPVGSGLGVLLFALAAVIGVKVASHTRNAVTDAVTILAAMTAGLVLVQLLDRPYRVRITLAVLVALGAVQLYQCSEQATSSNAMLIEQYEQDPGAQLAALGIEPGSFQHSLYEHRLYSKDIRGFFLTSNSAGSFLLICIAAALSLIVQTRTIEPISNRVLAQVLLGLMVLVLLAAMAIVQSKGAIGAMVVGLGLFLAWRWFGEWIYQRRKILTVAILFSAIVGVGAIIHTGFQQGRLPGGNGMLVRWQYWTATGQMIRDHALTGVGGGNFGIHYPRYKLPESLETIQDPHNFVLSLLAQYGPLGLLGFLLGIGWPILRDRNRSGVSATTADPNPQSAIPPVIILAGVGLCLVLLAIRPFFVAAQTVEGDQQMVLYVYLYLTPALVFACALLIVCAAIYRIEVTAVADETAVVILDCGILAVLMANLADFAIFEPGIGTALWALLACRITLKPSIPVQKYRSPVLVRVAMVAALVVAVGGYREWIFKPVINGGKKFQAAMRASTIRESLTLLETVVKMDPLNPDLPRMLGNARLQFAADKDQEQIRKAIAAFEFSARCNPASFKACERLSRAYEQLARTQTGDDQNASLLLAMAAADKTIERYPACDRMLFERARLAEQVGRNDLALRDYRRAVEVEDAYRAQFRIMYPNRTMTSRLGEKNYNYAKTRISELEKTSSTPSTP
ncbi:MAG: hypothetical protein GX455_15520 [Phycisphaerae bacterium]|nr:hypothetical protein [Phycisphaerae bacterium]